MTHEDGASRRTFLKRYDADAGKLTGDDGPSFVQVASDGGYLNEPVELADGLLLGSAQRGQWVVDFSDYAGKSLLLHNDAKAPYVGGDPSATRSTSYQSVESPVQKHERAR